MPIVQSDKKTVSSFLVDHTKITAPSVRQAKVMKTPKGDKITVFDLRFRVPNQEEKMPSTGAHTLEHLFAGFFREHLENFEVIDLSPMGCLTGFYCSVIGDPTLEEVKIAFHYSMIDVLDVISENEIPELNKYQCGSYEFHSLEEAQDIAQKVISTGIREIDNKKILLTKKQLRDITSTAGFSGNKD